MRRLLFLLLYVLSTTSSSSFVDERARDMLSQMTSQEKFSMMNGVGWGKFFLFESFFLCITSTVDRLLDITTRVLCGNDTGDSKIRYTIIEYAGCRSGKPLSRKRSFIFLLFRKRSIFLSPRHRVSERTNRVK